MSKSDRQKKRSQRRRQGPFKPIVGTVGANDNIATANDNGGPIVIRGITLTANQAHRMEVAEARLATRDPTLQRLGRDAMGTLDAEIDRAIASREREEAEREMQELAAGRGDTYSRGSGSDATLSIRRDGLETLAAKRKRADGTTVAAITSNQYAAGLRYRADYERLDPERKLTPPSPDSIKGPSHGGEGWDAKLREAHDRMMRVRLMIAGVDINPSWTPGDFTRAAMPRFSEGHPVTRAIKALDDVAGKGKNIREMASGGRARARLVDDLTFALDACAIVYDLG
jgi:hypothetical protein